ncbi:MAG: rsmB 1 [Pedosphaera sp.]|jgi:16S rRNA (cytosine967-C5)-methyltransferase|nr:rsmB 1 [Pedosphaera sp.]
MTEKIIHTAAEVVERASKEKPADAVLRTELRSRTGISREDGRAISIAVFAYYRWHGWLNLKETVPQQIRRALELNEAFQKNQLSVSDAELLRAVPGWIKDCVEVSTGWLRALQSEPALWLRARVGQGSELARELGDCRSAGAGALADALRYEGTKDLFRTPQFHGGRFELQDISSQVVGLVCDPKPGETWWDACAGEGGKTLHLGDLMRNKGLVWASDRAAWRLQQLKRRAARAGLFNYRTALWTGATKLPTKTKFDGILVDAPCSGLGTWQRNPHARWTVRPVDIVELAELQKRLLGNAVEALKPAGRLFYSVCTLSRNETSEVVEAITKQFPKLKPWPLPNPFDEGAAETNQLWLWPEKTGGNGMFIAAWENG